MRRHGLVWLLFAVGGTTCASQGTRPHDMSVADHEAAARREETLALETSARARQGCPGYDSDEACYRDWSGFKNPTKALFDDARRHRRLAQEHRAASQALRDAEAGYCVGVPDEERDISPFFHRDDIVGVERIPVDARGNLLSGRRVVFRKLRGMTPEMLQRVVDCHLARNAALGFDHQHHTPYCPLAIRGVTALVAAHPFGLAIELRPATERAARELRERTEALFDLARATGGRREIEIAVTERGFEPPDVVLRKGEPVTLVITRRTESTCATDVVLDDYGVSERLPLERPVRIAFTPERTGRLIYACAARRRVTGVIKIEARPQP